MPSGGRRPGSGKPPKNIDLSTRKISQEERELRKAASPNVGRFPDIPEDLLEGEKKIWEDIINEYKDFYEATGIMPINSLDKTALRNYCMFSNILNNLRAELKINSKAFVDVVTETKSTTTEKKGRASQSKRKVVNPIYSEIIKIETRQSTLAMQLNLTPDARARMGIAIAKNKEDALGKFLEDIDD